MHISKVSWKNKNDQETATQTYSEVKSPNPAIPPLIGRHVHLDQRSRVNENRACPPLLHTHPHNVRGTAVLPPRSCEVTRQHGVTSLHGNGGCQQNRLDSAVSICVLSTGLCVQWSQPCPLQHAASGGVQLLLTSDCQWRRDVPGEILPAHRLL